MKLQIGEVFQLDPCAVYFGRGLERIEAPLRRENNRALPRVVVVGRVEMRFMPQVAADLELLQRHAYRVPGHSRKTHTTDAVVEPPRSAVARPGVEIERESEPFDVEATPHGRIREPALHRGRGAVFPLELCLRQCQSELCGQEAQLDQVGGSFPIESPVHERDGLVELGETPRHELARDRRGEPTLTLETRCLAEAQDAVECQPDGKKPFREGSSQELSATRREFQAGSKPSAAVVRQLAGHLQYRITR